jgi:hypothetical protein
MTAMGHSRPGRAASKPGHVRYAPVATKFTIAAKSRDGPKRDVSDARLRTKPAPYEGCWPSALSMLGCGP